MDDDLSDDVTAFCQMARDFPVRTGIFTFALPLFALLQLINGYVHQGSVAVIGGFVVVMTLFSAQLTRYQLATYRRRRLDEQSFEDE